MNEFTLEDLIYSSVPARAFGFEQRIVVGPMSGESNVRAWLEEHGFRPTTGLVASVLAAAKASRRVLTTREVMATVQTTSNLFVDA